jgi:hypothetical protein
MSTPPIRAHLVPPAITRGPRPRGTPTMSFPTKITTEPKRVSASPLVPPAKGAHPKGEVPVTGAAQRRHPDDRGPKRNEEDPLDPLTRWGAQNAPPAVASPTPVAPNAPTAPIDPSSPMGVARTSLEELLPALVRKVAWVGDGRRGTVRMELGAGALAGATLLIHADEGRVRVELDAPSHVNATEWRARIHERLTRRGLLVDSIDVR